MDALEQVASEVLSLIRTMKNSFAPINRVPPEVLSIIPDYCDEDERDQDLIALTHICRGWREMFISRSSLWTQLDFTNDDKTQTYIQRSKSSPLEIYLERDEDNTYLDEAFFRVIPHIHRLKSLTIHADDLPDAIGYGYLDYHTPLLEELDINLTYPLDPVLHSALFNGNLSSLCKLTLGGVITHLPWNNMANLTVFNLKSCLPGHDFVTRLLDFFECAPLLHTIRLEDSIPVSSDAPPGRIVSLLRLHVFSIIAQPAHSILLNHLRIPVGASLILGCSFRGENSPLLDYLPKTSANLENLSHITTINLHFDATKLVQMKGPSGGLCLLSHWECETISPCTMDRRILLSLDQTILSTIRELAVSKYRPRPADAEKCPIFQTLFFTDDLRTLTLTKCYNLPFILALNPERNPSKLVLCPNLEELVLYIKLRDQFHIEDLVSMTKKRALRGAKLSSITIVGLGELVSGARVFKLREHVTHVEYRIDDATPDWDHLSDESSDESE